MEDLVAMNRDEVLKRINAIEWYHVIEVAPGLLTPGRSNPKALLSVMGFPEDFTGKTVLDIGAYDGFFTFEAEKRGAKRVLALDRHPADYKGFALARELLNSKAEYAIGSVYDLSPETHGVFDVVLLLGVLYHLRHPLLAIEKIHSVCRELFFIESRILPRKLIPLDWILGLGSTPIMQFFPTDELNKDYSNWWSPNIECLRLMLETSGFRAKLAGRWADRVAFKASRLDFTRPPAWY
jgi:tRNA (mo5U34)-methyltransferase